MLPEKKSQRRGFALFESLAQDCHYGLRGLRNSPAFSCIAILTLALGIGATTAIFSVVNTVLLRPLPYHDSERLIHVWTKSSMFPELSMGMSLLDFQDVRARAHSLEKIALYNPTKLSLTGNGAPESLEAARISPDFISLFSEHPILGRLFDSTDEDRKNGDVALLSYSLWQRRFGGDPNIVGKPVDLEQRPYTIIGVMPDGFSFPAKAEVWVPLIMKPEDRDNRDWWMHLGIAKLRPGVSVSSAQRELHTIAVELGREYRKGDYEVDFWPNTLLEQTVGNDKSQLFVLLAAVGFLLLIACGNVSNLVLARGLQRRREIAVRTALGASRGRIVRQLATESLVLALLGGPVGLLLAFAGVYLFRDFAPPDFPRLNELHFQPMMGMFALLLSAFCALLCGLAPAFTASRSDPGAAMKEKPGAAMATAGRFSLRSILVITELALALLLLTGSALMVQSMVRLLKVDTGLQTDHIVTAELNLPPLRYPSQDNQRVFVGQLLDSLRSQAAFKGVALSNNSVLEHNTSLMSFEPAMLGSNDKEGNLEVRSVSPGFFETLGVRLISGRFFNDHDAHGSAEVIVINESMAKRFFSGASPVGRVIKFDKEAKEQFEIVGVVADTRDVQLSKEPRLQVYFSILQNPFNGVHIIVRSPLDVRAVTEFLQNSVWAVDKDLPVSKVRSMAEVISGTISGSRFRTWLMSAFAACGLTLTLIGIYGVISYSVSQRAHEMGIRMALGASRANLLKLVLGSGARMALLGAVIGIMGSLLLMRVLSSQLYAIKPNDPATLIVAALLLVAVALLASYIPARRASRVDPMVALRDE
jgi:putative ABC transport system permease protein